MKEDQLSLESKTNSTNTTSKKEDEEKADKDEEDSRKKLLTPMDENLREEIKKKLSHLEIKNGGISEKFTWSQPDVNSMEIYIPVPSDIVAKRDIKITYGSKHIKVVIKGEIVIDGDFFSSINADTLVWTVDDNKNGKYIIISFGKLVRMSWWEVAIKGYPVVFIPKHISDVTKLSEVDDSMRPESKFNNIIIF